MSTRVIHLHPEAPAKPRPGEACNGCGVCCAAEPCPVGIVVSGRRHGPCAALRWSDEAGRHRCSLASGRGEGWTALPAFARPAAAGLAPRWIAAGRGGDSDLEVLPATPRIG